MRRALTTIGVYTSSPIAFAAVAAYVVLWLILRPTEFDWHAAATVATWFMTLFIQRAEHRDTQAIQGKLDEILHALGDARNEVMRLDEAEPEEIEEKRGQIRDQD
jgi:low affinity Fe/Cu permease